MDKPNGKRKMVPMFSAADFFSGKEDAKPVGWMSDPDQPGPVIVDLKTLESLLDDNAPGMGCIMERPYLRSMPFMADTTLEAQYEIRNNIRHTCKSGGA